jgi:phosphoenolpyruvate synthase/pyruvate phosphate dikinase
MGQYSGIARVIEPNYSNYGSLDQILSEMKAGEVLVAESTSPDIIRACKLAGAIIANQGGMGSHAAIISREMGIPCLVGTQNATQRISTGDLVYVNANNGYIEILERGKAVS